MLTILVLIDTSDATATSTDILSGKTAYIDGEKIKLANAGDEILGVISGTVAVLGDNYECEWNGKYLTDDFGKVIYDLVEEFVVYGHITHCEW